MCFGNSTTQTTNTSGSQSGTATYTPNQNVANAANQSLSFAQMLQNMGYQPYTGQRVADFSPLQQQGFGVASNMVNAQNQNLGQEEQYLSNYGNTQLNAVNPNTIASGMSPYMNQYVSQALAPQLEAQNQQFAAQDQQLNAAATSSGAFGDARAGIQAANLTNQQDIAQTGLLGQAYTNAFNTAIGASAQDVANSMGAQEFNVGSQETMAQNQLGAANAMQALYGSQLSDMAAQYGLSAQAGGQQQQQAQAQLNVPYSNYLAAQQYPFLTEQMLNSAIGTGAQALPPSVATTGQYQGTQITQQPNNSGWALLGGLMPSLFQGGNQGFSGSALGSLFGLISDERDKEDMTEIGKTKDGQKIYRFRYKGDPTNTVHIGFSAQEVEKKHPGAVANVGGHKVVDYNKATAFSEAVDPDYKMAA